MNDHMNRRMIVEEQLMNALQRDEIFLMYQPIIDLESGLPGKFEVLARWNNPKLGFVAPDEFIPLAEHNGFIVPLGEYVLHEAIKACVRLRQVYGMSCAVTVNVSPRQLNDPHFATHVFELMETYQLPPRNLVLEVTEGVLINHKEQSEYALKQLADYGIRLAMDDFGTGYSSLSYIRNYPFDILKIDKEFIQDMSKDIKSVELVESVLAMANSMRIDVVAEGVETQVQAEKLQEMGCLTAQGFYYSRPLKEDDLVRWLDEKFRREVAEQ